MRVSIPGLISWAATRPAPTVAFAPIPSLFRVRSTCEGLIRTGEKLPLPSKTVHFQDSRLVQETRTAEDHTVWIRDVLKTERGERNPRQYSGNDGRSGRHFYKRVLRRFPDMVDGASHAVGVKLSRRTRRRTAGGTRLRARPRHDRRVLPPQDRTCSFFGSVREVLAGPDSERHNRDRYDSIGAESGGIWRTRVAGILPVTVIASPKCTAWMTAQEARRNAVVQNPPSVVKLMGPKALTNLEGNHPGFYNKLWKVYAEAFSRGAIAQMQDVVSAAVQKRISRFEVFARRQQEVSMLDELIVLTLEIILVSFLGADYATDDVLDEVFHIFPKFSAGFFSPIARRVPWPFRKLPLMAFGQSQDARHELKHFFARVIEERRADRLPEATSTKQGGVLDTFLDMQAHGQDAEETGGETKPILDDDFVFDNVVQFLFGGYETTSVMISRLLQVLGSSGDQELKKELMLELDRECFGPHDELGTRKGAASSVRGLFSSYPVLDAITLETYRMFPVVPGVMRKVFQDAELNGYTIPAGKLIYWGLGSAFSAESTYPEPEKFCPFRFLPGVKTKSEDSATGVLPGRVATSPGQPRPQMFGAGKHMCPGRELARLEIIEFLRAFLTKFDFELVEGQSFKATLPLGAPKDRLRVMLKEKLTP